MLSRSNPSRSRTVKAASMMRSRLSGTRAGEEARFAGRSHGGGGRSAPAFSGSLLIDLLVDLDLHFYHSGRPGRTALRAGEQRS